MAGQGTHARSLRLANDFWFDTLGFPILRVSKATANNASRRISERHRMRLVGTAEKDYVSGRLTSEIYELTAVEWHSVKACSASPAR